MPVSRVCDHSLRFVHDQQARILVINLERNVFGFNIRGRLIAKKDLNALARTDFVRFLRYFALDAHQARVYELVYLMPGNGGKGLLEIAINPLPLLARCCGQEEGLLGNGRIRHECRLRACVAAGARTKRG